MSHMGQASAPPTRMEIFRLLVSAQDMDMTVAESRQYIMHRFGVSESEVRRIEREGVARSWPPL
jgi:hypothetical protein